MNTQSYVVALDRLEVKDALHVLYICMCMQCKYIGLWLYTNETRPNNLFSFMKHYAPAITYIGII